ncbi:hypothetical protein CTEN210_11626 [Chaetoceros tenuissimus]|uniref:MYND-type domain-containing protein n=1 Tax=Chaetoceros tenuissimus TaxID=426638 RepID=A0AAD3D268_9STRA|nr:hypothetical protein CTEN210_11626 [Chaetoceros tenuissimus]
MVKKKSSSNRKKNRKGVAGKKASPAGDHVPAYLRYLRNKPNLTSREIRLRPMYTYAEASNMSEVVLFKDENSLRKAINDIESWTAADLLYYKDPRMWLFTIQDMFSEDKHMFEKVFEESANEWLEITKERAESMIISAITSESIHGVMIEGLVLKFTVMFLMEIMQKMTATFDAITTGGTFCFLMEDLVEITKETKKISTETGSTLCQIMVFSFVHLHNTISMGAAHFTVLMSEILEQVLRHITLPWLLEPFIVQEEHMIRNFFRTLCCPNVSMSKTFKRGSPLHNVLLDILEGRVRPCKENKFVMASLYSLKRFIDLRYFKLIDTNISNPTIEQFRRTCLKCKKVDHSKQMRVCAKCKFVSYCSKECQVEDWKDHKVDCGSFDQPKCKIERKFTRKFLAKHQHLLIEKLKSASVETGLETMELAIDLDFCGSGHVIAPAMRELPEFAIEQATYCLHQSEKKTIVDSMTSKLGKKFVFLCLSFEDTDFGCVCAVQLQSDTFGEIWRNMAKKKTSRASRKKNRKGAAGKAKAASTTSERINSKQEDMSPVNNADFRPFQNDGRLPLSSQTAAQNANHHIQNQSLGSKEQERLLKKMDAIYNKDLRKWVETLLTMLGTGEFYSLGPCMSAVFDKLVFLVKNAISATKKKDVLLDGLHLHTVVNVMVPLMHVMDTDEDAVLDLLKSFTNTAKTVSGTHYSSSGAAYVMCHSMILSYFHIREKKRDDAKPLIMIAKSGMLEQVLLHIHLSWSPPVDAPTLLDGYNGHLYKFFGYLNSYTAELHKIFKEGTGCHNALDAIVHGRIHPCKDNEHMMEILHSLKKISDLSNCSKNISDKELDKDETVIDIARHSCAKCNTIDLERPLLVCAKCKGVGYCSKECQVTDWKKHKVECLKVQSVKKFDTTVSTEGAKNTPVINLTRRICAKCEKVYPDKQLLVCAKCKYIGYCSKECQVSDWKDHKEQCEIYAKTKYKNIDEITQNFCLEHRNLIAEKVKAVSEETGLASIDLAVDLNFTSASGEERAPANHWFFKDLGRGKAYYSDNEIKKIRESVTSKQETLGLNLDLVFVFLNFGETPSICAIPSGVGIIGNMESNLGLESLMKSMFVERAMKSRKRDDIPESMRAQYEKDTRELLTKTFEAVFGRLFNKK